METETAETETIQTEETLAPTVVETQSETQTETQPQTEPETENVQIPTNTPIVDETKVGKVGKLNKDTKFTDQIQFYWDAVEGAQGYRIYYKNDDIHDDAMDADFEQM